MLTTITSACTRDELLQIITLQNKNHFENIADQKNAKDGFVTLRHSIELLTEMNNTAPQIIAKKNDRVVGYALVMLPSFKNMIPALQPMFEMLKDISFNDKKISECTYYVMGQICISEEVRGTGIFDNLYLKHKEVYSKNYDLCITLVSAKNLRSLKAHTRIGFKIIKNFKDEYDEWFIISWDWS